MDKENNVASYDQNLVFNGLGTLSLEVPSAGVYFVKGKLLLPTIVSGAGASSVLVTINQNGSPIYVGQAGAEGFYADLSCAAFDTIAIVLTSSAAADLVLNAVKTTISIGMGQ